jgi:hypothetical protein
MVSQTLYLPFLIFYMQIFYLPSHPESMKGRNSKTLAWCILFACHCMSCFLFVFNFLATATAYHGLQPCYLYFLAIPRYSTSSTHLASFPHQLLCGQLMQSGNGQVRSGWKSGTLWDKLSLTVQPLILWLELGVRATADWQVWVWKWAKSGRGSEVSLLRNSVDTSIIPGRGSEEERMKIPLQEELYVPVEY